MIGAYEMKMLFIQKKKELTEVAVLSVETFTQLFTER